MSPPRITSSDPLYRVRLGQEGRPEWIILVTCFHGFYLSVRPWRRYWRLAIWQYGLRWHFGRS